jgi:hypothetical protein
MSTKKDKSYFNWNFNYDDDEIVKYHDAKIKVAMNLNYSAGNWKNEKTLKFFIFNTKFSQAIEYFIFFVFYLSSLKKSNSLY